MAAATEDSGFTAMRRVMTLIESGEAAQQSRALALLDTLTPEEVELLDMLLDDEDTRRLALAAETAMLERAARQTQAGLARAVLYALVLLGCAIVWVMD